ncbi:MAG: 1-acyl-sn-glycerol-3-phosphate acyltransferase [Tannerella sp.]|jgi:putative hemolysin|nr:1-acyl-sn-glycerol-3-phosphate acyltransferase [Tannerella sp.]
MDTQINVRQVLRSKLKDKADRIPRFVVNYLIRILHQDELNEILRRYRDLQGVEFMEALVEDYFKVELKIQQKENLPSPEGRYIFVSNHPLGGFDGICLSCLIGKQYGGKVKYFVNDLLLAIPNLYSLFVPINKHGSQSKEAVRKMDEAYRSDNQIITFPAGLCSRKRNGVIRDPEWKKSFIQKAIEHKRDVVPIYFEGRNSNFFYRLANIRTFFNIKMNLEMLYLPDELFKQKNKSFKIHIGKPVSWQTFDTNRKAGEWAARMKEEVYKLADK